MFYKNHIPKLKLTTKTLQLIDKNLDKFEHWDCDFNCVKSPCYCKNINLVCRYVYYKYYA